MNKMNMKKVVMAVGTAMVLGAGVQAAQADSLLFPYYKVGAGVYSFVSLMNTNAATVTPHYIWNYKADATNRTSACIHEDAYGKLTSMDLIQHTVQDPSLSTLNLQTQFGDTSTPAYSLTNGVQGFMIVDSNTAVESDFVGQMIVIDTSNGTVASYKGFNNVAVPGSAAGGAGEGNFSSIFTSQTSYDMTWYPTSVVATTWFATVTGTGMNVTTGWNGAGTFTNGNALGNVWNRDEGTRSGNQATPITCFAQLDRSNLMSAAQVTHTTNGGYTWQVFTPNVATTATGVLVTKLEATTQLGGVAAVSSENAFPNLPY